MTFLELQKISKTIGNKVILHEIDFKVGKGEIVAIIGPPGSGKTTLLKIISGLLAPTSGRIYLEGKDITNTPPHERGFSMVFEIPPVYPDRTGYENIAFPLRLKKLNEDEIRKRVLAVADLLGIRHILDRKPSTYSGGEYQRVALARALVTEPRLLLLDEPFRNLDAKIREAMVSWFKDLHKKIGVTIIYSTHDPLEGMTMGDKILVLLKGIQKQFGSASELLARPTDLDVDEFISIPALNILKGYIDECSESGVKLSFKNAMLKIPKKLLKCERGQEVFVAFRPHDVKIDTGEGVGVFKGRIININYTGRNQLVSLETDDTIIRAVVGKDVKLKIGSTVSIIPSIENLRLYDANTKKLLE
ncbi:MAG: ABC transporter ATP-binding protein [Ignisphaera sp.]|nr:ABC transporter ATP-binding protein [Ignisphaera sp.]